MVVDANAPFGGLLFGHTKEWWEAAITYYNAARPEDPVDKDGIMEVFTNSRCFKGAQILKVLEFWRVHKSQAKLLLPEPRIYPC